MRIALDTNVYSALGRGGLEDGLVARIERAEFLAFPVPVLAELYAGFNLGRLTAGNLENLEKFLLMENVEILHTSLKTAEIYGQLFAVLKKKGRPVPINDLWISALVIEHGYELCTADRHFKAVPDLRLMMV